MKLDEKNSLKKPFKMMDPEFSKLLLRFVRNLRTIDQLKSEDRCIVKHNQEIFGIVAPSDGCKTGAGSCAYILTEKIHHEPTVKDDERIMVDIPIATKLIESGKKISEKDWKGIIFSDEDPNMMNKYRQQFGVEPDLQETHAGNSKILRG